MTRLFKTTIDENTGEADVALNDEATEAINAVWENHVLKEICTQTQALEEAMQERMDEHLVAMANAADEAMDEKINNWLPEKADEYDEYLMEQFESLKEENGLLKAALDVLGAQVFRGDLNAFYQKVHRYVNANAVNGPGSASGAAYGSGVPGGSAAKNKASIRAGDSGTSGSSEVNGPRLHETTLVERSDGKITSLARHRQQSSVARYIAHADRSMGIHSPGATVPTVVDAAVVDKNVGARLLAEQAPDGSFMEGVEERIAEPQERGVAIRHGGRVRMTNLVHAEATRGDVYAAIEDEMPPSWTSGHLK